MLERDQAVVLCIFFFLLWLSVSWFDFVCVPTPLYSKQTRVVRGTVVSQPHLLLCFRYAILDETHSSVHMGAQEEGRRVHVRARRARKARAHTLHC